MGLLSFRLERIMNKTVQTAVRVQQNWQDLVEAAIFETDSENLTDRLQDAQNAVMDEIEDSFHTASPTERQSLINAMNSLRELRRVSEKSGWNAGEKNRKFIQA